MNIFKELNVVIRLRINNKIVKAVKLVNTLLLYKLPVDLAYKFIHLIKQENKKSNQPL